MNQTLEVLYETKMTNHTEYKCPQPCEKEHCIFCDGGLFFCTVCKCGERTLARDCPGEPVDQEIQDAIMDGLLDFVDRGWVVNK